MASTHSAEYTEVRIPVPWGYIAGRWYGDQLVRPILSLHGWLDNCGTFARLVPLLTAHGSFLCVDLPGHGLSTHLPVGCVYHNMDYVRAILRIMRAYNWKKVSLLGHSMGCTLSYYFASIHPDLVDMIVGIDLIKSIYYGPHIQPQVLNYSLERVLIDNERRLYQTGMQEPPSYAYAELEQLLYEGSEQSVMPENCKYILERNITKSEIYPDKYYFSRDGRIKYMLELNPDWPLTKEMANRLCNKPLPHLLIRGGATKNASALARDIIDYLDECNPLFSVHEIPGGTHHVHLNDPVPVAQLIIPFLEKYRSIEAIRAEADAERKHPSAKL